MKRLAFGVVLGLAMASLSGEAAAIAPTFFNGFETDTAGWCNDPAFSSVDPLCTGVPNPGRGTITQVSDGYVNTVPYASGIFSAAGTHHARLRRPTNCETQQAGGGPVNRCRGPYTEWNNSDYNFPTGGFSTQVDVYLDVGYASANPDCYSCDDSRYDFSSAISTPTGDHLRDFVFNVGTAPNGDTSICANGGFVVSASQNANRDSTFPSNPQKEPQCIATSAWYTFRHRFFDNGGNLAVDMDILNSSGQTVASWKLPNRSSATRGDAVDLISTAGCALYGYFSNQEIQDLAIDNSQMDGCGVPPTADIGVTKFYDANANGVKDGGESNLTGWKVSISDGVSFTTVTGTTSLTQTVPAPGSYTVAESSPTQTNWFQTTPSSVATSVAIGDTKSVAFGNTCVGAGGGLSMGFWGGKNGQALFTPSTDLPLLVSLNLRNANGTNFNPTSYNDFKNWLSKASSMNMAYMLSAQLAAIELSVAHGKVSGSALVYAPGTTSANAAGFATVSALMSEANAELGAHGTASSGSPYRAYQNTLKNALESANLNKSFVQPAPCAFTFLP